MNRRPYYKPLNRDALRMIFKIKDSDDPESLYVDSSDEYSNSVEDDPLFVTSESSSESDYVRYDHHNVTPNSEEEQQPIMEEDMEGAVGGTVPNNQEPELESMNIGSPEFSYNVYIDPDGVMHVLGKDAEVEVMTEPEETAVAPTTIDQSELERKIDSETKILNENHKEEPDETTDPWTIVHQYSRPQTPNENIEGAQSMTEPGSSVNQQESKHYKYLHHYSRPEITYEAGSTTNKQGPKRYKYLSKYIRLNISEYSETGQSMTDAAPVNQQESKRFKYLHQYTKLETINENSNDAEVMTDAPSTSNQVSQAGFEPFVYVDQYAGAETMNNSPKDVEVVTEAPFFVYVNPNDATPTMKESPEAELDPLTVGSYEYVHGSEETARESYEESSEKPPNLCKSNQQQEYYVNIDKYFHKVLYGHPKVAGILPDPPFPPVPPVTRQTDQPKFQYYRNLDDGPKMIPGMSNAAEGTNEPGTSAKVVPGSSQAATSSTAEDGQQPIVAEHPDDNRNEMNDGEDSDSSSDSVTANETQPRVIGRFYYTEIDDEDDYDDDDREWFNFDTDPDCY